MNPKFSRKQRVDAVMKEYEANDAYLAQQPIHTLRAIKNSMEIEAGKQTDPVKKFEMEKIAQQANDEVSFRKSKVFIKLAKDQQKLKNLHVVRQIKQSRKVISTQAIIAAIVSILQGLLIYFQSNQRDDWFTTAVKILIFLFIVLFFVAIGYNYFCQRKIQQGQYQQLQQAEEELTRTPERRK